MVAVANASGNSSLAQFARETNALGAKVVQLFQPHRPKQEKKKEKRETFEELLQRAERVSFETSPCQWEQHIIFHLSDKESVKRKFGLGELISIITNGYSLEKTDGQTWAIVHFNVAGAVIARRVLFHALPDDLRDRYRGKMITGKTARDRASETRGKNPTGHSAILGPNKGPSGGGNKHGHNGKGKKK